jgi:hypothetical protein
METKVAAFAWPIVALIATLLFRRPLTELLVTLRKVARRGRGFKLGIAGVKLELGGTTSESEDRVAAITDIPFAAELGGFASSGRNYIEALIQGPPVEAVTIDLRTGQGDGFLSSRLYLTSVLMSRQRDLEVVAFVETKGVRERVYLGA